MNQDQGASASADRAATPSEPSPAVSGKAGIPCAWTPGPWHVFVSSYAASHHNSVEINDHGGLTVAWAQKFVKPYVEQSEANASLIAAAPQLYEALFEMVHDAERNQRPGGGDVVPAKAFLALAKARGDA